MFFSALPILILLLIPITAGALLFIIQRQLLRRHSRGRIILPAVITGLMIVLLFCNVYAITDAFHGTIRTYWFTFDASCHGKLYVYGTENMQEIKAVGQLIINPGEHARYLDLTFAQGQLTGPEEALSYQAALMEALNDDLGDFTGKSLTLSELDTRYAADHEAAVGRQFLPANLISGLLYFGVIPTLLWIMYFIDRYRRKTAQQLNKMKLQELS